MTNVLDPLNLKSIDKNLKDLAKVANDYSTLLSQISKFLGSENGVKIVKKALISKKDFKVNTLDRVVNQNIKSLAQTTREIEQLGKQTGAYIDRQPVSVNVGQAKFNEIENQKQAKFDAQKRLKPKSKERLKLNLQKFKPQIASVNTKDTVKNLQIAKRNELIDKRFEPRQKTKIANTPKVKEPLKIEDTSEIEPVQIKRVKPVKARKEKPEKPVKRVKLTAQIRASLKPKRGPSKAYLLAKKRGKEKADEAERKQATHAATHEKAQKRENLKGTLLEDIFGNLFSEVDQDTGIQDDGSGNSLLDDLNDLGSGEPKTRQERAQERRNKIKAKNAKARRTAAKARLKRMRARRVPVSNSRIGRAVSRVKSIATAVKESGAAGRAINAVKSFRQADIVKSVMSTGKATMGVGKVALGGVGRFIPWLGAGLATADVASNVATANDVNASEQERHTAKNAAIGGGVGTVLGGVIGGFIGGTAGSIVPVAGTAAGAVAGALEGAQIGEMICSKIGENADELGNVFSVGLTSVQGMLSDGMASVGESLADISPIVQTVALGPLALIGKDNRDSVEEAYKKVILPTITGVFGPGSIFSDSFKLLSESFKGFGEKIVEYFRNNGIESPKGLAPSDINNDPKILDSVNFGIHSAIEGAPALGSQVYESASSTASDIKAGYESGGVGGALKATGNAVAGPINNLLYSGTKAGEAAGVKYGYGSKNSASGAIDCSGLITELNKKVGASATDEATKRGADIIVKGAAMGGAAGILQASSQAGGGLLKNEEINTSNLKAGMVIGLDAAHGGAKSGAGRFMDIDHVVQVVQNPTTGQLEIAESSSHKGVHTTNADQWLAMYKKKGAQIYASNPYANVVDSKLTSGVVANTESTPVKVPVQTASASKSVDSKLTSGVVANTESTPVKVPVQTAIYSTVKPTVTGDVNVLTYQAPPQIPSNVEYITIDAQNVIMLGSDGDAQTGTNGAVSNAGVMGQTNGAVSNAGVMGQTNVLAESKPLQNYGTPQTNAMPQGSNLNAGSVLRNVTDSNNDINSEKIISLASTVPADKGIYGKPETYGSKPDIKSTAEEDDKRVPELTKIFGYKSTQMPESDSYKRLAEVKELLAKPSVMEPQHKSLTDMVGDAKKSTVYAYGDTKSTGVEGDEIDKIMNSGYYGKSITAQNSPISQEEALKRLERKLSCN